MRLIDADELLKKKYLDEFAEGVVSCEDIINAPTIKTFTLADIEEQYRKGLEKGLSEWETERPQGEWEYNPNIGNWHCSFCHNICYEMKLAHDNYNFCPNCGADMRGDNNG